MNLVERAAKRLEEIGRSSSQAAVRAPSGDARPDLVETAIQRIHAGSPQIAAPTPSIEFEPQHTIPAASGLEGRRLPPTDERRVIGARPTPKASTEQSSAQPDGHRPMSPRLDLDLVRLASLGYLQPSDPDSTLANEFRKIKRPLIQACQGKLAAPVPNANRLMITSSVPGEGKSYVALNLALSIAMERDSTVLLVDADTTRRSLSRLLGLGSRPGLLDVLSRDQVALPDVLVRTNLPRLTLLPAGEARRHATELLASAAMEDLIEELASRYTDRILIFDTPPLLGASEPAALAAHMGQIIVVVEADKTTHRILAQALATIQSCPFVTTVLNKTSSAGAGYYYYAA